jgi:hypothetical protein
MTLVPLPTCEAMCTNPPAVVTAPYTIDRPRPDPSAGALVVKYGSKARATTAGAKPVPVSVTMRRTNALDLSIDAVDPVGRSEFCTETTRDPPSGITSRALTARLTTISSS